MDRGIFKTWMDEMQEQQGLFRMTAVEADAEYDLLTLDEDKEKWITDEEEEAEKEGANPVR